MNQQAPDINEDQQEIIALYPTRPQINMRLDRFVAEEMPDFSRSYLQQLVIDGMLILWFEAVAIWAFAIAWLVKGRVEERLTRPR